MDNLNLGKFLAQWPHRDATHVAVAPVCAGEGEVVRRGDFIRLAAGSERVVVKCDPKDAHGIADPFLTEPWPEQDCRQPTFWMWLLPGTITSLRHEWTHPAFPNSDDFSSSKPQTCSPEESERWLREFAKHADCPDFDTLIAAATGQHVARVDEEYHPQAYENDGEYLYFGGRAAHGNIPPEFWSHVENYTGVKIEFDKKASVFTCSC